MAAIKHDAHARPPENVRNMFKKWQKSSPEDLGSDLRIFDTNSLTEDDRARECDVHDTAVRQAMLACQMFLAHGMSQDLLSKLRCFEVKSLPGLFIYPSLLPVEIQIALLDKLLHRDLSNSNHNTNLHLHYHMPTISDSETVSLFHLEPTSTIHPKDASIHKPISVTQTLEKKLRWVTLGGQYDWTQKVYPPGEQPKFPEDVSSLLQGFFPMVDPQAAILNFYSPGDTLSLHRDVSEECDRGLISLSIGCEAIFLVANSNGTESATIRLRSGDTLLMSGQSRYAWHAVPKVLPGTCPEVVRSWPATGADTEYEQWRGWLSNKRINLNDSEQLKFGDRVTILQQLEVMKASDLLMVDPAKYEDI